MLRPCGNKLSVQLRGLDVEKKIIHVLYGCKTRWECRTHG